MRPTKWISILLAMILLLQPLACSKRICAVTAGQGTAANDDEILYVTLKDGGQYELVEWEIGPEWIVGKRQMFNVTIEDDGTVTEEECLEPVRFSFSDIADLNVEKLDRRSFWVLGAIAGGVAAGFVAMATMGGEGGVGSGCTDPGPVGDK